MQRWGVPFEVLTDNVKQFTGKFTRPLPVEVLFERTCREYGITARLTKRRSPTTTGKIERFHRTLRRERLDEVGAFATIAAAQAAVDEWIHAYNTPAFRPRIPPPGGVRTTTDRILYAVGCRMKSGITPAGQPHDSGGGIVGPSMVLFVRDYWEAGYTVDSCSLVLAEQPKVRAARQSRSVNWVAVSPYLSKVSSSGAPL
ncbi:integrase catalytic subunit [Rhodococcus opacus M213]|jgi:hypothetical protein|uniref:Integrase catalytic subunit n=1 Tax=Rhodococcus opacus M213 TaxID=1129896 RepID=K8X5T4_RHOOP|nr:integrase catalytic subunit [Rhodococcus opacus M213]